MGANANATNNLALLEEVIFIKPVSINSANKDAPMSMTSVGKIPFTYTSGEIIRPLCYYSPFINGTIISPMSIVYEYEQCFRGFSKVCNCKDNTGYVSLDPLKVPEDQAILPLYSTNKLWYHKEKYKSTMKDKGICKKISKLTNAVCYKLWHQRLCHPGKTIMGNIHKHLKNLPLLKRNSF